MKFCEIDPSKKCTDCGDCDVCDLDSEKICDNCEKCLQPQEDFAKIKIDRIVLDEETVKH